MTRLTIVLLVLLRLAIGWHLGYEGWTKARKGTFTSEDYLRESTGPLAPYFHDLAGDSLAARLTPGPLPPDPTKDDLSTAFPPALAKEWDAWFDRFADHYDLGEEQRADAAKKIKERKSAFVRWLQAHRVTTYRASPLGPQLPPVPLEQSVAERIDTYQKKQEEIRAFLADDYRRADGTAYEDGAKAKLAALRREAAEVRAGLRTELKQQTDEMQKAVSSVLSDEQWQKPLAPARVRPGLWKRDLLGWTDLAVTAALLVLGGCLMLGLFTRTAAVLAALLLLSFYLAMPPWPGLPEPPQVEGNYLFVNKNVIEVLALLVLASSAVGRWFGLDGAIRAWRDRRRWKRKDEG